MTSTPQQPVVDRGETFGPYIVYERLGVGGMATVHRAKELGIEGFERVVALKRLLPHMAEDESFVRAFVREAKLASLLQHANIVQIYELGRVGAEYFISMEYIEGRDVRKLLRQARRVAGPPPVPVVTAILMQVCDALDYAHTRCDEAGTPLGIVHRDVSPSNLLITPSGHIKVIDFGIAKAQNLNQRTQTGRVKGKLAYMSPEGTRGHRVDRRSDLFSLGVICHELLTARPLFATKNDYQTLMRVQNAEVAPPSTYNQHCPAELDAITLKALAKDPAERWQSAGEMRDALHEMRAHYQLEASQRQIASFMEWAFSQEAPPSGRHTGERPSFSGASETPVKVHFSTSRSSTETPVTGVSSSVQSAALPPVEADEEIIEIAWGGRDDAAPVLLDDVPDVSEKVPADSSGDTLVGYAPRPSRRPTEPQAWAHGSDHPIPRARPATTTDRVRRPRRPRPTTEFGQAIVQRRRSGRRTGLITAVLVVLAGAAAAALFVTRGRGGAASSSAPVDTATLRFVVEPEDATVAIDGGDPHAGSPYTTEVEPGRYQVAVHRDGYESWISTIEIAADETQTVRVALEPAHGEDAQVTIRSTPAGLTATLDGEPLEGTTPLTIPLAPGEHVLELASEHGTVWEHRFDAEAATRYELQPSLEDEVERARRHYYRALDDEEIETVIELAPSNDSSAPAAPDRGAAGPTPLPLTPSEPPEAPRRRIEPVIIPPTAAERRAGSVPELALPDEVVDERRVSAKLCIDTRGAVTDVSLFTTLPDGAATTLREGLSAWRYRPHRQDGEAVPACFVESFRLR